MFSLTVQYSICPSIFPSSQSARSHVWAQYAQNPSSHWNFHPCCVMGLGLPSQLHLMILHTNIISNSEAAKGSCVSSQTAKNSQTNAEKLTADNTEGSFLAGRNPFFARTGGIIIPQGCTKEALSAGVNQSEEAGKSSRINRSPSGRKQSLSVVLKSARRRKRCNNFQFSNFTFSFNARFFFLI